MYGVEIYGRVRHFGVDARELFQSGIGFTTSMKALGKTR